MTKYVYLDLETTGLDPERNGVIQVGLVLDLSTYFESEVYPFGAEFDYEASQVNGVFSREFLKSGGVDLTNHPINIDFQMREWLEQFGEKGEFCAVGWNVGSFDMQFVKKNFPNTYKMFGYRNLDLTALRIFATEEYGLDRDIMQLWAERMLIEKKEWQPDRHDALYDAMVSMFEHEYLTEFIKLQGEKP